MQPRYMPSTRNRTHDPQCTGQGSDWPGLPARLFLRMLFLKSQVVHKPARGWLSYGKSRPCQEFARVSIILMARVKISSPIARTRPTGRESCPSLDAVLRPQPSQMRAPSLPVGRVVLLDSRERIFVPGVQGDGSVAQIADLAEWAFTSGPLVLRLSHPHPGSPSPPPGKRD